jgi:hypothetical protein
MRSLKVFLWVLVGCLVSASAFGQAASSTISSSVPISLSVFIPCAAGGNGEVVDLSGNLHVVFSDTINANHVHLYSHFNPQGVTGTGETTGAKYQATGETLQSFDFSVVSFPFTTTFVNNFKIIGQGPGNNFAVHENAHVTINANGTLTASVDNFSATCM